MKKPLMNAKRLKTHRQPWLAGICIGTLLAAPHAWAAGELPNAGSLLQQIRPEQAPAPSRADPGLPLPKPSEAGLPESAPFEVRRIEIKGHTVFDTASLHALVADAEGTRQNLAQWGEVAGRITRYYQEHGYPFARAYIPAQSLVDGVLVIGVIEARYGQVRVDNKSTVNDGLLQETLAGLQSGALVQQDELERALLLLSDIPGIVPRSAVTPGQATGTSDLQVEVVPGAAATGSVTADSYGNAYTGYTRLSAQAQVYNPLQRGDVLSLNAMSSGPGMTYGRAAYESVLNGQGTSAGVAYSAVQYKLGGSMAHLQAHGDAQVSTVWVKQPWVRGRDANVYARLQYEGKRLRDRVDTGPVNTDRHLGNWTAALSGDVRDAVLAGGLNSWSLSVTAGRVGFDDAQAATADRKSAQTQGGFDKLNVNASRLQTLNTDASLLLTLSVQHAKSNLDASEKMSVGGPASVRAYNSGAVTGDSGQFVSLEYRHQLGGWAGGNWMGRAFVDTALVRINQTSWSDTSSNNATLSGTGLGLDWSTPDQWQVRVSVATRTGQRPVQVSDTSTTRVWLEVSKGF